MSWQRGERIAPRYVKTDDEDYLRVAEDLLNLFAEHEGERRGALDEAVQEYVGTETDYKVLRGFVKLLTDRCEFETASAAEPAEMRRVVFAKARESHPVVSEEARSRVLEESASELLTEAEALAASLYADLPENQRLARFEPLTPAQLLDLYNVAQAQALLYRCVEMHLWVEPQEPEGFRELFGAIKAYRLIHTVRGNARDGYEIRLDGPVSLFHRSQKYGVQMAVFLPALLLCEGWRMRAEVQTKRDRTAYFELSSRATRLRSHYESVEGYANPAVEKLLSNWGRAAAGANWKISASSEVIDLGESAFVPDFVLEDETGARVYLEVLGFWTPQHLRERLREFEHARITNFILAAWDELRGSRDPLTNVPPNVFVYKSSLDPAALCAMAERLTAERLTDEPDRQT